MIKYINFSPLAIGVPQDLFVQIANIIFADDTTPHLHDCVLERLISRFVNNFADTSDWIDHNCF
jgi:hypothetical protein